MSSIAKHDQAGNQRKRNEARKRWAPRMPEILRRLAAGESQASIARGYRCSQMALSHAVRNYR